MIVVWENVVSAHGSATAYNGESLGNCFFGFSLLLLILYFTNVSKTVIITKEKINCMHNTKE